MQEVSGERKSKVIQILSQITNTDINSIKDSTKMSELHLDSLMRVELVAWVEESLNIIIEESQIVPSTTIKQLEEMILSKQPIKENIKLKK